MSSEIISEMDLKQIEVKLFSNYLSNRFEKTFLKDQDLVQKNPRKWIFKSIKISTGMGLSWLRQFAWAYHHPLRVRILWMPPREVVGRAVYSNIWSYWPVDMLVKTSKWSDWISPWALWPDVEIKSGPIFLYEMPKKHNICFHLHR